MSTRRPRRPDTESSANDLLFPDGTTWLHLTIDPVPHGGNCELWFVYDRVGVKEPSGCKVVMDSWAVRDLFAWFRGKDGVQEDPTGLSIPLEEVDTDGQSWDH